MPLHPRSISISIAVVCLFVISFIGWFAGLAPLTCCKRAMTGAFVAYIVTRIAVNIINNIIISVLVKSRMEEQKGEIGGRGI
jgi:hypothetical protein